jgi:hypothetical protein
MLEGAGGAAWFHSLLQKAVSKERAAAKKVRPWPDQMSLYCNGPLLAVAEPLGDDLVVAAVGTDHLEASIEGVHELAALLEHQAERVGA